MQAHALKWQPKTGWKVQNNKSAAELKNAQLVIYFGAPKALASGEYLNDLKKTYPDAHFIGCSTGGEIIGSEVLDDSVVATAMRFDKTKIATASIEAPSPDQSREYGRILAKKFDTKNLRHIFLLSDGLNINGSELVKGMIESLPSTVVVTGGLAADGADFKHTMVGIDSAPKSKIVAAVGLYGDSIQITYGSVGGWDQFGPERTVTKSKGNVLFELDGQPALDLYKKYLGEEAKKLPGSGLFFPLAVRTPHAKNDNTVVRTILNINEEDKSMISAGDIPQGSIVRLMKANFENLIDGAAKAAELTNSKKDSNSVALLVNCIGRKIVLGQHAADETEAIAEVLGASVPTIGFYSYGEICHHEVTKECSFHNQTMTVTLLTEK